ncbi:hypothetical protein ANANG_G00147770 [Anguilla anguilla]|uniref:RING-type domain-containing protein n=1 Tax=Anguilla anguilla TaxID=7936 RepID=A0A9D3ME13_ANGAN|nr:hypothetical protein ANANG_G00147770 [Anguilla anguilla]
MASSSELLSEEQFQCSICREVFSSPVSTPCGHSFCRACIQGYWQSRGRATAPDVGRTSLDGQGSAQLKKTEAEMQQMMQDRWRKVEEIRQCVELSRSSTQREMEDSVLVFSTLKRSIEIRQAKLTEVMEEKQRAVEKHAEGLIKDLEQELTELQTRSTELEKLSQTEDHLYFLQSFPSLCSPPNTKDWSGAGVHTDVCVGTVRRAVEQLEVSLTQQVDKLAEKVGVALDCSTAHPWLALSEDRRCVRDGDEQQDVPDGPPRFDTAPCVLAEEGFSSGRRYWEVQSREQIEEQCLRLQEENTLLRHHCRTQDHRLRRMSAKLLRLREGRAGSSGLREAELEETVQELEGRVSALESQKRALQSKLSLARQHILELGSRATTLPYRNKGRGQDTEGGVRRAAQTAPPRYGLGSLQNTREETERLRCSVIETQQVRMAELESAVQSLRDALREKEREIEDSMRELRRQQADGHRVSIRENVDMIRQQKQLSEKSAALLVIQEKFTVLQEVYEAQLEEAFRLQREGEDKLQFLQPDGKVEDCSRELTSLQASHAETVLELHKCRDMLLLQHRINTELQGLRTMGRGRDEPGTGGEDRGQEIVTFCTYSFLDFETHSTPLVCGPQPNYGFTSRYPLSARDLGQEPFDYGGGIPNELEVVLDRCVGLSAHWPGLLPDTYLLYRLYDLPPHATPTIPGSADPVFGDVVSYPLAATPDLLLYLRGGSLWVYAFDDRDDQTASSYLAKTPIPLRNLATGRPIRGDYVLRDAGGCPRGMVRVSLRWKYPFQPPQVLQSTREGTESPKTTVAKPRGNKLRVEILSLSLDPASCVALDQSVQRVYVEYRLLGVPMETTETPISLRKPIAGEEIHFNFIRVMGVGEEEEDTVGKLKVSLEAAWALKEIYWEHRGHRQREGETEEDEEEEEEEEKKRGEKEQTQDDDDF